MRTTRKFLQDTFINVRLSGDVYVLVNSHRQQLVSIERASERVFQ